MDNVYFCTTRKMWRAYTPSLGGKVITKRFEKKQDAVNFIDQFNQENKDILEKQREAKKSKHLNKKGICMNCHKEFIWSGYYEKNYCSRVCASVSRFENYRGKTKKQREKLKKQRLEAVRKTEDYRIYNAKKQAKYYKTENGKKYLSEYRSRQESKQRRNFLKSKEKYGQFAEAHRILLNFETIIKEKLDGTKC